MIAKWVHPKLREKIERYNLLLESYWILELGDEKDGYPTLELPLPPSMEQSFVLDWYR